MSEDLISRQAAIDALDERFDSIPMEQTSEILMLRKDLRDLPSAQPEPFMVTRDHELTKDEVERLKQSMSNTPIVLFPSVQSEIVRCKDCKHWKGNDEPIPWNDDNVFIEVPCETKPMDFCSMGERKEDDER